MTGLTLAHSRTNATSTRTPLLPRPSLPRLLSAFVVVGCLGAGAAHAAADVAVFALDAPGLLPGVRDNLDGQLRAGLTAAGFSIQGKDKTERFVKDAVDAGLSCSLSEEDCVRKAAVAASVDAVVVGRALIIDNDLVVELRLVHVDGTGTGTAVGLIASDAPPEASFTRLGRRLSNPAEPGAATALPVPVTTEPKDVLMTVDGRRIDDARRARGIVWLEPGPHLVQVSASGFDARTVPVDVAGDRLPPPLTITLEKSFPVLVGVGAGVGVAGGVLALAGGIGLGIAEAQLGSVLSPEDRNTWKSLGLVFVGTTVVGVAAAAAGTTAALVGASE